MLKIRRALWPALAVLVSGPAGADPAEPVDAQAWRALIDDGDVALSFRYRFENVGDDRFDKDANASTMRTRLGLTSGQVAGVQFMLEFDDLHQIGADSYNAGAGNTPSMAQYPVIADPEGTEVNQAWVDWRHGAFGARGGRQRINFDNQRFVGGVGWRQNEQTFDAVKLGWESDAVNAQYVYVNKVRRIFGDDVPAGTHDQDGTHLVNLSGGLGDLGRLSGYYYRIDDEEDATFSTATAGVRLDGKTAAAAEDLAFTYAIEYAHQSDAGDNPVGYDADYWHLDAGVAVNGWSAGLGWEVLGGDEDDVGKAFRTPFATLHAFNGWADVFLATPHAGLDDRYVKAQFTPGRVIAEARLHSFEAADGGLDLGSEINLRLGYKFTDWLQVDGFYARFDGESGLADVTKLWFMVSVTL